MPKQKLKPIPEFAPELFMGKKGIDVDFLVKTFGWKKSARFKDKYKD